MNRPVAVSILSCVLCFVTVNGLSVLRAQDTTRHEKPKEIVFNIELTTDQSLFATSVLRTREDGLIAKLPNGKDTMLFGRRVVRVTSLGTPLMAPYELQWDSIPLVPDTVPPCPECYCNALEAGKSFFEVHVGVDWRGSASDTLQTITGPVVRTTHGFQSASEDGTIGTLQADASFGWRWDRVRFGGFIGAFNTDGSFFLPAGLHFAYDIGWFVPDVSKDIGFCPNIFLNAAIPFDFRTHAPIFFSTFKRTRKFFSGGLGFERRLSAHWNWSIDLGAEYLTVPLSYVPCDCDIPNQDHYPVRSIFSTILVVGVSF